MTWLGFQLGLSQGQNQGVRRMYSNLDLRVLFQARVGGLQNLALCWLLVRGCCQFQKAIPWPLPRGPSIFKASSGESPSHGTPP